MNDEAKVEFKGTVMNKKGADQKKALETLQKSNEEAAKKVAHATKSD